MAASKSLSASSLTAQQRLMSLAHLRVGMDCSFVKALELDGACAVHSQANDRGGFLGVFAGELLITQGRDFDLNVDPA